MVQHRMIQHQRRRPALQGCRTPQGRHSPVQQASIIMCWYSYLLTSHVLDMHHARGRTAHRGLGLEPLPAEALSQVAAQEPNSLKPVQTPI